MKGAGMLCLEFRETLDAGAIGHDAPVADLRRMKGDQSLEDIFLELTGGKEVDEMVKELSNGG